MAEFLSTKQICVQMREYVKAESRRIRLLGVRAKAVIILENTYNAQKLIKILSWADITTQIYKLGKKDSAFMCEKIINEHLNDNSTHAIMVIPDKNSDMQRLYDLIPYEKDAMFSGAKAMASMMRVGSRICKPYFCEAVMRMFSYGGVDVSGKNAVVFGSNTNARLLGYTLMQNGAYVTIAPAASGSVIETARNSDILISLLNSPGSISTMFFNERQTVVDFGCRVGNDGRKRGDVVFYEAEKFVKNMFVDTDTWFEELENYIIVENVLKSAALNVKEI